MTVIWKENGFVENDPWVIETDDRKAGEGEKAMIAFSHLIETGLDSSNEGTGVVLSPTDDPALLEPFLGRIDLIALIFTAFSDGRAFSQATLLRERLGYEGEIRAIGDVLLDPLVLMLRCGFDSFSVENETAIRRLKEGNLPVVTRHYQPAAREASTCGSYSWRRVSTI